jgi:hypothetical protein
MERGVSAASKWISRMVLSLRSTSALVVIISLTKSPRPPENSRHSVRKGALVIPAMGASTTGGSAVSGPMRKGWVTLPFSRTTRAPGPGPYRASPTIACSFSSRSLVSSSAGV